MKKDHTHIRTIAVLSAMFITLSAFSSVPLTAADTKSASESTVSQEEQTVKKAAADIKKRIKIPKSLNKFSYETRTYRNKTMYRLRWYSEDKEEITVDYRNGFISSCRYNIGNTAPEQKNSKTLSEKALLRYARKHINAINPTLEGNMILTEDTSYTSESQIKFSISRTENNIPVATGNSGFIILDTKTGELIRHDIDWWNDIEFPDAENILSEEEISAIYAENRGIREYYELFSKTYHDDKTDREITEYYTLPIYSNENIVMTCFDASTGKEADYQNRNYTEDYFENYPSDEEYDGYHDIDTPGYYDEDMTDYFSEDKLKQLEKENRFISSEAALRIVRADKYLDFGSNAQLYDKKLYTYTDPSGIERYAYKLLYSSEDISSELHIDAVSGNILSYNSWEIIYETCRPEDLRKAQKTAEAAAKKILGKKFSEYKPDEKYQNNNLCFFTYKRYVNGIEAPFDTISICVNHRNKVTDFSYTYHDIKFPEPELIGKEKAFEKLFEKIKPDLTYTAFFDKASPRMVLIYEYPTPYFYINALTGELLEECYSGAPYCAYSS